MATIRKSNRTVACSNPIRNETATELWLAHDCQKKPLPSDPVCDSDRTVGGFAILASTSAQSPVSSVPNENSRLRTGKISLQPSCMEQMTLLWRHGIKAHGMKNSKDSKSSIAKSPGPWLLVHARLCPISYYEIRHLYYLFLPVRYCRIFS